MVYFVIAVIFIVIIAAVVTFKSFSRKRKIIKSGRKGEKKVQKRLKRFASMRKFKVINDIYLPLYDKTTQIDHILIGFFGILVIETKNYKGDIYGDPGAKNWTHIVGADKNEMYNPLMQNQAHIDCIRHILSKSNIYNVKIESLVVFADKNVGLYVPKGTPVIKINRLMKYLKQSKFRKDNDIDVEKVYNALENARVTDKSLIAKHNKNVKVMSKM